MERLFKTHEIRKQRELSGLWDFYKEGAQEDTRKVIVPSCFETYPGLENYTGVGCYEYKTFLQGNIRLCFKGVSHTAKVYLDGNPVIEHYNAYTPFSVVLKGVEKGIHTLKVTADNSCHEESALHVINDYYNYGGISRPVIAENIGDIFIEWLHFTPYFEENIWKGEAALCIHNLSQGRRVKIKYYLNDTLLGEAPEEVKEGSNVVKTQFSFPEVTAYQPENPVLYYLKAVLEVDGREEDDLIERIGFREIRVKDGRILWNGRAICVKGFNRHEDHGLFGCAIPVEAMDYDLRLIKESGANAVRTCHYPNDERFLDLCDEMGIMVWEESHARGLSEKQMRHKNFRSQSLSCIDEMVREHFNHPCIFTWGILNECASDTEYGREVYQEQYNRLRELDQSRPLTSATCKHFCDICLDLPDIVSVNIYPLWYNDEPVDECLEKEYEWIQSAGGKGKPVLVSEIGAGAIAGVHSSCRQKWSEERQADILREQLAGVLSHPEYSGVFLWQFSDGRVPDECFYARPRCMNNKGVVDEYRRKKLGFEAVKEAFGK